jgi:hypothetical protein
VDKTEQLVLDNIERYGCHVWEIAAEGELPAFQYSVGIQRTTGAPELIIIGLKSDVAHWAINEYRRFVQGGRRFKHGEKCADFFEGLEVVFLQVDRIHYPEYFGWNHWFYRGDNFEVLQLVWPSAEGFWPWQPHAAEFGRGQPFLGRLPDFAVN